MASAGLVTGVSVLGTERLHAYAADAGQPTRVDALPSQGRDAPGKAAPNLFSEDWRAGDEVFAIDPKMVVGIDLEDPLHTIVVSRSSGTRGRFAMTVTTRATGKVERCKADVLMQALLPSLSSVRVVRSFTHGDAEALWARRERRSAALRIRDKLDEEAKVFQVLLSDDPGSLDGALIVFREESHLFVPSVRADTIHRLAAGCANAQPERRPADRR